LGQPLLRALYFGLYVHNEVVLAFGTPKKQILIKPIFAHGIQSAHGKTSYRLNVLLSSTSGPTFDVGPSIWLHGWLNAINDNRNSLFLAMGLELFGSSCYYSRFI